MSGRQKAALGSVMVCTAFFLAACQPGGLAGGGGTAGSAASGSSCNPYGIAGTPLQSVLPGPVPNRINGAVCMVGQSFRGTANVLPDFQGFRDSVGLCIPDGVYNFSTRAAVNNQCVGPTSPAVTVREGLDYVGDLRRDGSTVCVQQSRVDFRSFSVTGTPLDAPVADNAKAQTLEEVDLSVATQFNALIKGASAPAVTRSNFRCSGWSENPNRPTP